MRSSVIGKVKAMVLAAATAGMVYGSVCSAVDVRHNFVAGTGAFVKGFTTDFWEAVFPDPAEFANWWGDDAD